jgi:hypothetical protein
MRRFLSQVTIIIFSLSVTNGVAPFQETAVNSRHHVGWQCGLKLCNCDTHAHNHTRHLSHSDHDIGYTKASHQGSGAQKDTKPLQFLGIRNLEVHVQNETSLLIEEKNSAYFLFQDLRKDKPPQATLLSVR